MLFFHVLQARAVDTYWTNAAGGLYSTASNWTPNNVPGIFDNALFTNAGAYSMVIDGGATNSEVIFRQGSVTQSVSGSVWWVTNDWLVGELINSTSRVSLASGQFAVTNAAGTGRTYVGRVGTGELAIRGGNLVTDFLQADSGSRSLLTFGDGVLTTLHGSAINGTNELVLGTTPNKTFTWNILGGVNQVLNPGDYGYGSLTLTNGGKAVVNLSGAGTTLKTLGLDTYAGSVINIGEGAVFHTAQVQLGLSGQIQGTNNTVVISGPGSAWINDDLMYFGMHAGGQTLIITNGGYFRTGASNNTADLTTLDTVGNRIVVTGSNSWFYSDGTANFGMQWCGPNPCQLDNLVLITNGGHFWMRTLAYGSTNQLLSGVSSPGTVVDVADGSLWIGSLSFGVGTLRFEAGTGKIDQLNINGGTNALLQVAGTAYTGFHGSPSPGDLQIGGSISTIPGLNGSLRLGGWTLGADVGDNGTATVTGAQTDVTNALSTAALRVGSNGVGSLYLSGGIVNADRALVGESAGGSGTVTISGNGLLRGKFLSLGNNSTTAGQGRISLTNGGTLEANVIEGGLGGMGSIGGNGGVLQFTTNTPSVFPNTISLTNGVVSFRAITNAPTVLADAGDVINGQFSGGVRLQLANASNAPVPLVVFQTNSPGSFTGVILSSGTNSLVGDNILIAPGAGLAATNTTSVVIGSITNQGTFAMSNSLVTFLSPVDFEPGSVLSSAGSESYFRGGLLVRSNGLFIPPGNVLEANQMFFDGGSLAGSGSTLQFTTSSPSISGGGRVTLTNGIISFKDMMGAPWDFSSALSNVTIVGDVILRLNNSSNAPAGNYTVGSGVPNQFAGLYLLGGNTKWQSAGLSVGSGGVLLISNTVATVDLTGGSLSISGGGKVLNAIGSSVGQVGLSSNSMNFNASVSGANSLWQNSGPFSVGSLAGNNQLTLASGGVLTDTAGYVGEMAGSSNNMVWVIGGGAKWQNSGALSIGYSGGGNRLTIGGGGTASDSTGTIGYQANSNVVWVTDINSTWTNSGALTVGRSGSGNMLVVTNGARVISASGQLSSFTGGNNNVAWITGTNSLWTNSGSFGIGSSPFGSGSGNVMVITNGGRVACSSGEVGYNFGGLGGNAVVITGNGSTWDMSTLLVDGGQQTNELSLVEGGRVNCSTAGIGRGYISSRARLEVSGVGSLLNVTNDFRAGMDCGGASLVITNSGTIFDRDGYVGSFAPTTGSAPPQPVVTATVTGAGSLWTNRGTLYVGRGTSPFTADSFLNVLSGGTVMASNLFLGLSNTNNNRITIGGGNLIITNGLTPGVADLRLGTLSLTGGLFVVDRLVVTNGTNATVNFVAGTLITRGTTIGNNAAFVVGDGNSPATLNVLAGVHTFSNGLLIAQSASLSGTGAITGSVTNRGFISPGITFGTLSFNNDLHLQSSSSLLFDVGGTNPGTQVDSVSVTGMVEFGGALRISVASGYQPDPTAVYTLMQFGSSVGAFNNVANGRVATADNLGSFKVTYSGNALQISDFQSNDLDGDGINDAWAMQYFGHSPLGSGTSPDEKYGDKDGDGMSNYAEFLAGTDPNDAASYFKIAAKPGTATGAVSLQFPYVFGRTYRIWYSQDLVNWNEFANPQFTYPAQGQCQWDSAGSDVSTAFRFYRVSVQ